MIKLLSTIPIISCLIGCSDPAAPLCYAKMKLGNKNYEVPIFSFNGMPDREYLAGGPVFGWTNKNQFTDFSQCENKIL